MSNIYVIRDTREHDNHGWGFTPDPKSALYRGTLETKLETGDYTIATRNPDDNSLRVFDKLLCIERKESVVEVANNLFEDRFYAELERMKDVKLAYIVCEFSFNDFAKYPFILGIPKHRVARIKVRGPLLIKKIVEIQLKYPNIKWMFAGGFGKAFSEQIIKEILRDKSFTVDWLNNPEAGKIVQLADTASHEVVNGDKVIKIDQVIVKPARKRGRKPL